jgi:hypothetical protein
VFAADIHSVRFAKTTLVRDTPDGEQAGVVRAGTRAAVAGEAPASGSCKSRWIELAPRGWVCESAIEPSREEPLAADDVVEPPFGVYGVVRGGEAQAYTSRDDAANGENGRALVGANTVRAVGTATIDGRRYWRTSQGELVDESSIIQIAPSKFAGIELGADAALPAWVWPRRAHVRNSRGRVVRELAPRTIVHIEETSADTRSVRIGDDEWIARADLRVAVLAAPPDDVGGSDRWIDVDLDDQVLVAYEGKTPIFATLVSTGKYMHETPALVSRVESKHERARMTNDKAGEEYSVADVPWTQYYDRGFALHTSYWHDGFGSPRSHGCINLSIADARFLYHWSAPALPPGWTVAYANANHPGSLVRIHSRRTPDPTLRGYARLMHNRDGALAAN